MHKPLEEVLKQLDDQTSPTLDDEAYLFNAAYHHVENLLNGRTIRAEKRAIKQSLLDFLYGAIPALSKTRKAFERRFEILYNCWGANGKTEDALFDLRQTESGQDSYWCEPCFKTVHDLALQMRGQSGKQGNVTSAYREARRLGLLCQACRARYPLNERKNKSYVPWAFRRNV